MEKIHTLFAVVMLVALWAAFAISINGSPPDTAVKAETVKQSVHACATAERTENGTFIAANFTAYRMPTVVKKRKGYQIRKWAFERYNSKPKTAPTGNRAREKV